MSTASTATKNPSSPRLPKLSSQTPINGGFKTRPLPSWLTNAATSPRAPKRTPEQLAELRQRARKLRKVFSKTDMIVESGDLNPEYVAEAVKRIGALFFFACRAHMQNRYFKPRFAHEEERKWGIAEKQALLSGLKTYGVGAFDDIRTNLLPQWVS